MSTSNGRCYLIYLLEIFVRRYIVEPSTYQISVGQWVSDPEMHHVNLEVQ